jgi:nucleoside-diphosphate-sugar epimerase
LKKLRKVPNVTAHPVRGQVPAEDLAEILDSSRARFEKLLSSKILICGATGFVGTWLTSSLLQANEEMNLDLEIVIISRNADFAKKRLNPRHEDPLTIVTGDLASEKNPLATLGHEFTHILHLATPTVAATGSLDDMRHASTIEGARNLVEYASHMFAPPVLVHASSGGVYGKQPLSLEKIEEGWINENLENEISAYGRAKLEAENIIGQASREGIVRAANPRLFAFLGPHLALDAHFAVGNFMRDALADTAIRMEGNPSTTRSYLYPTDMTDWLLAILVEPHEEILHLGSRIPVHMSELAQQISEAFNRTPISYLGTDVPASNYVPETQVIQSIYGVNQRIGLAEAIVRWAKWLKTR